MYRFEYEFNHKANEALLIELRSRHMGDKPKAFSSRVKDYEPFALNDGEVEYLIKIIEKDLKRKEK